MTREAIASTSTNTIAMYDTRGMQRSLATDRDSGRFKGFGHVEFVEGAASEQVGPGFMV